MNAARTALAAWILAAAAPPPAPAGDCAGADLAISELMAANSETLLDEDGDSSDWIEIHNRGFTPCDLDGWSLTDDITRPRQWPFPPVSLEGGGYLLVFASGKDRRLAGSELHANFRLSSAGEYLALVRPDGSTAHAYSPRYPAQRPDVSYGIGEDLLVDPVVPAESEARVVVPRDGSLGTTWTGGAEPFDDSAWLRGFQGTGYLVSLPGFAVRLVLASTAVSDLATAQEVARNPALQARVFSENARVINYFNTGGTGHYGGDSPFPGTRIGEDENDFVVEALAAVTIPQAGPWTFGVSSDDGFRLEIEGPGASFAIEHPAPRGPGDTLGVFTVPSAGSYDLRLLAYERGGGSEVELFALRGSATSWSSGFRLVGDTAAGGLAVEADAGVFGSLAGYRSLISVDLEALMYRAHPGAYVRLPFDLADPAAYGSLTLRVKYDDGLVAYLNGMEVARRGAPATVSFDSRATGDRPPASALVYEHVDVSEHLGLLRPGRNILALHGLNDSPQSGDFLLLAELAEVTVESMAEGFFAEPTPAAPNAAAFIDFVADTKFDPDRGFYEEPLAVTITTATPGAEIRTTTDGSEPSLTNGFTYTGPIPIERTTTLRAAAFKEGFAPTNVDTHTYVFLQDVPVQDGAGFPPLWGSRVADYEVDPDVTGDARYAPTFLEDLKSIPSLSLVMDRADLFDPNRGIYANAERTGAAWERPGSVELILPEGLEIPGGGRGFQVNCGVRMHGGVGRVPSVPKHSFRFLFKGDYGPTKLRYPLFAASEQLAGSGATEEFDTLILRAGFNNSWVWNSPGENRQAQYLRDQFIRDSLLAMGRPSPHGIFVHLYLNGLYWGLYNFVERSSAPFAASYFGGAKDEWDVLNSGEAIDGDRGAWDEMHRLAEAGLEADAAYAAIHEYLDVPNLIDYMLVNFYGGNSDWDGHNWYAGRRREAGAGYKFFSWDAERTLESTTGADRTGIDNQGQPSRLYSRLRANAEFRMLFADHSERHLAGGGALSPEKAGDRYRRRALEIEGAIAGESARWGDTWREEPYTRDIEWAAERDRLLGDYFPRRTQVLLSQLRAAGLYPGVDPPRFSRPGGEVAAGFRLLLSTTAGAVYYTLDGPDPRLPGGFLHPQALAAGSASASPLVTAASEVHVLVPADGSLGLDWTLPGFDDAGWTAGTGGVGYERSSGYENLIGTDVGAQMYGVTTSVYIRLPFAVADPPALAFLTLRVKFDDGFVAYLNGVEVAARNAPAERGWDSTAAANHSDSETVVFETIEIPQGPALLAAGPNVLALQGLNVSATSSDLLILAELDAAQVSGDGIAIERTTTVRARTARDGEWSALSQATFAVGSAELRVTEVMYHPAPPPAGSAWGSEDLEFLELQNTGVRPLNPSGMRLAGGIDFVFPPGAPAEDLEPGGLVLVVKNLEAFASRYRTAGLRIAGEYRGNLGNDGDRLELVSAAGVVVLAFAYDDAWHAVTDGLGYSLVPLDARAEPEAWSRRELWRPSVLEGGSPGAEESLTGGLVLPSDANLDGAVDLTDAVAVLWLLFGEGRSLPCGDGTLSDPGNRTVLDPNGDVRVDVSDAVYLLRHLFRGGPGPVLGASCVPVDGCPTACGF